MIGVRYSPQHSQDCHEQPTLPTTHLGSTLLLLVPEHASKGVAHGGKEAICTPALGTTTTTATAATAWGRGTKNVPLLVFHLVPQHTSGHMHMHTLKVSR